MLQAASSISETVPGPSYIKQTIVFNFTASPSLEATESCASMTVRAASLSLPEPVAIEPPRPRFRRICATISTTSVNAPRKKKSSCGRDFSPSLGRSKERGGDDVRAQLRAPRVLDRRRSAPSTAFSRRRNVRRCLSDRASRRWRCSLGPFDQLVLQRDGKKRAFNADWRIDGITKSFEAWSFSKSGFRLHLAPTSHSGASGSGGTLAEISVKLPERSLVL